MKHWFYVSTLVLASSLTLAAQQTQTITGVDELGRPAVVTIVINTDGEPPPEPEPAKSFGLWSPTAQDTCTKAEHDSYYVIAPDGKKYPTWHPAEHTRPATMLRTIARVATFGLIAQETCTFGHEHGSRDPRGALAWPLVLEAYWFDANGDGIMNAEEEAVTGLPFGYAAEQLDAADGLTMRHEDHVGHKVDYANGEPDIATHRMSTDPVGGVWVGKLGNGVVAQDTGVRCFYLAKVHQGLHSPDAFTNNVHEVLYFADCRAADNPSMNQKIALTMMVPFGKPGGFFSQRGDGRCGGRRQAEQDFIQVQDPPPAYPVGPYGSGLEIVTRDCVELMFLVPSGQFSGNMYEAWASSLIVGDPGAPKLLEGINLLFDSNAAARYYDPAQPLKRGYSVDLCYEVLPDGRKARGGLCGVTLQNYPGEIIKFDDPRSPFLGTQRGTYFMPGKISNNLAPIVYTTVYGRSPSTTPFPGSVAQRIPMGTINYSALIGGSAIDPRVRLFTHSGPGVHLPN